MTDSKQGGGGEDVKSQVRDLLTSMMRFLESASEEQQERLMGCLRQFEPDDRRKHVRKSCTVPVTVGVLRVFSEMIKDISEGGLFIETTSSFSPGEELVLIFSPPDPAEPIKITGKVVRKTPDGVGVKFAEPLSKKLLKVIRSL